MNLAATHYGASLPCIPRLGVSDFAGREHLHLSTKLGPTVPVNIGPTLERVGVVRFASPERSGGGVNRRRNLAPSGSSFLLSFHGAAEAVGLASGLEDVGAIGDAVEQRFAEAGVGEDRGPLGEEQVGGDDDGCLLCAVGGITISGSPAHAGIDP